MEIGLTILKVSFYLSLVMVPSMGMRPKICDSYECPTYKVDAVGNGYEICMYDSAVWMSGSFPDPSMTQATKTGYQRFFSYIKGNNKNMVKMNMTLPVITQETPQKSVYKVSFYVPKMNQQNPPPADDLHVQSWKPTYVAVREVGGYVSDDADNKEVAALMESLKGSKWFLPIEKSKEYFVADYNPLFRSKNKVNEIWIPFNM